MSADARRFGTFTGVFTPTLLTILGVIMYVRLPWVVGNAGLMGAWLLMGLAMLITVCTGLSLSSIATNTRLGAGGPYAIISRALGYEVGGSIGIPLYLSRPLGTAMYIFGFREGWQWLFPNHYALAIDLVTFAVLFGLAFKSADIAFRVQYLIMALIGLSLLSVLFAPTTFAPTHTPTMWGDYPGFPEKGFEGTTFWVVFAVFFPATTGILAGANMSGELADPRRSIPTGTLWAIGLSSIIYFFLAWWCARSGSVEELQSNYNFMIDNSRFGVLVMLGLLGATFSSALASLVGGPRILMAMGEHNLLPYSPWLAAKGDDGEPRNAVALTGVLTLLVLMFRDLNVIAPLVTMFFLITYLVINLVLLLEQTLGLVSFRPTLRIPWFVPLLGVIGSAFSMFIVNPTFSLIAVATVFLIYAWIRAKGLERSGEDMRSSVFEAVAEWAATKVTEMKGANVRAWKPNVLVPVVDPTELKGALPLIYDITRPEGTVKLLGLATDRTATSLEPEIAQLGRQLQDQVFTTWSVIDTAGFVPGIQTGIQALQSAFFRPNVMFLSTPDDQNQDEDFADIIRLSLRTGVGVVLLAPHPKAGLGSRKTVNLLVNPRDWQAGAAHAFSSRGNLNLMVLSAYRLHRTWGAHLNVVTIIENQEDLGSVRAFIQEICDLARIPPSASQIVLVGSFEEQLSRLPKADLTVLGLDADSRMSSVRKMVQDTSSTCLVVADSGRESALA